jgi:ABC-type phosphate/phosphonate transport system substrate-binding protein
MNDRVLRVGAVAYDPKVVAIWEGLREYFRDAGVPTDYVLFSNYEAQVAALLEGMIDVAWNTNVAFVRCEATTGGRCVVLGMRNTDRGFTTRLVARTDAGVAGLADLRGKRLALGSADSAQAAILPVQWLRQAGIDPERDLELLRFDLDVGKHGDTGTSELEVLRALHDGTADAGAVGDSTWVRELETGRVNSALVRSVWTSPRTPIATSPRSPSSTSTWDGGWTEALLAMDYNDPRWRHLMDLEGLTSLLPGQKEGYAELTEVMGERLAAPAAG